MLLIKPSLRWLETPVIAVCVILTDPVLASVVIGKGKFVDRLCQTIYVTFFGQMQDVTMAFPFLFLASFF